MLPTAPASFMATPVEVDADIDFEFDGDVDLPPPRGKLSRACAEAVQALTELQRRITPIIGRDDDAGVDRGWVPIDWQAGVAELLDVRGNVRTKLRVAPAQRTSDPEAIDEVARAFIRLVDGAVRALGPYSVSDRQITRWPKPSTVALDGDVLRIDSFVIGRRLSLPDAKESFWAMRPDVGELQYLMFQRPARSAKWVANNGVDRYPRPTYERQTPASTRQAGRFDETWVFDLAGDADVATVLANSRAEPTRLFRLARQPAPVLDETALREVCRDEDESPAPADDDTAAGASAVPAPERQVRAMVVGDSARHEGSVQARVGDYDAPTLARTLKMAFLKIADIDGIAPVVPTHVSIISSHHESEAFRSDPDVREASFGTSFLKRAIELFDAPAMTASMRKDGFRVASQRPRVLQHRDGDRPIGFHHNVVQTDEPDLDGRKFVRSAAGDYLNKAPGGTVKLWRAADGSIRSADKYPDLGQMHVKDTWLAPLEEPGQTSVPRPAQQPEKLISWLHQRSSPADRSIARTDPGPTKTPGRPRSTPPISSERLMLGEVKIERSLLHRMGYRGDRWPLDESGAFLRLRFAPDAVVALMDDGTVPERITVLRLLRQMLRAGVPMAKVYEMPDPRSAAAAHFSAAMNLLVALYMALDDDLMLPTVLWDALWDGTPPPLPQQVPAKGMDLSGPPVR